MKILITGGAGFIGSNLADHLVKKGHQIAIIDDLSAGLKENINPGAMFYKADICSPRIGSIFEKERPRIVFHLAAKTDTAKSLEDPAKDARVNIMGGLNILENCLKYKVKKIIFASSGGAMYGEAGVFPTPESHPACPLSPYGVAKLAIEKYLDSLAFSGLPSVSLRFGNVYGPRQSFAGEAGVVAIFCNQILNQKQPIINGNGRQTRDFVYVNDAVGACVLAMEGNKTGVFNIATAQETSILALLKIINKETGFSSKPVCLAVKSGGQKRSSLDWSKAKKELGWQSAYSLEEGIKSTIRWYGHNT